MRKNVAGQSVSAELVATATGNAFTGAVTVFVTVDNGAQALGSVGAGACTHKGNGLHTYLPSQAETNGDCINFTFTGAGAVPAGIEIYTADLDELASIIEVELTSYGALQPTVAGRTLDVTVTGEAGIDWSNIGTPAAIVNLANTNIAVDQVIAEVTGNVANVLAIAAGAITNTSFAASGLTAIAEEWLTIDMATITGEAARSPLNAIRFLRNRWDLVLGVLTVMKEDDLTPAWTATTTGTPAADPITAVDPT